MKTFLEWLNNKSLTFDVFNEALKDGDLWKGMEKFVSLIGKYAGCDLRRTLCDVATIDGKKNTMCIYVPSKKSEVYAIGFCWKSVESSEKAISQHLTSVLFFDNTSFSNFFAKGECDGVTKLDVLGNGLVSVIPLVGDVIKKGVGILKDAKTATELAAQNLKVENLTIDDINYKIYENLSDDVIESATNFNIANFNEGRKTPNTELGLYRKNIGLERKKAPDDVTRKEWTKLYNQLTKAINAGVTTMKDFELGLYKDVNVTSTPIQGIPKEQEEVLDNAHRGPESSFKIMRKFLEMIRDNRGKYGYLVSGGAGIGKTHAIKTFLKQNHMDYRYINGKCTPKQLYVNMYEMRERGQVLFIDDADSLIGGKNEDCAAILKAALDGDDNDGKGRLVSWRTQGKILDDDGMEIDKTLYYNGNIIIATNFLLGNVEQAIKSRCYTQEMVFSFKEIIDYIRDNIMAYIKTTQGMEIPTKIKIQVIDYFDELSAKPEYKNLALNVRTFQTACEMFEACADDDVEWVRSFVLEQLINVSKEEKGKY